MSRILIEATPFEIGGLDSDFRHLYLVFVDDQGVETVITAAPDEDGPVDFGNIEVSAGGLLEDSDVARGNDTPGSRGSREIDVGDRDPADVWAVMLQQAQNIDQASLDYQPLGDNSNTVISSVLQAVGIDARNNLPNAIDRDEVPGLTNELDFGTTLIGAAGDDVIVGGDRADVLRGQAGDDALRGGPGGDVISGGAGSDRLTGEEGADRLLGGPGLDTLEGNQDADRALRRAGRRRLVRQSRSGPAAWRPGRRHAARRRGRRPPRRRCRQRPADRRRGRRSAQRRAGGGPDARRSRQRRVRLRPPRRRAATPSWTSRPARAPTAWSWPTCSTASIRPPPTPTTSSA